MKKEYADEWNDPLWQKCRLRVMERDGFTCTECGDVSTQLQVHHLYYISGRKPWEYPNWALTTLCKTCHSPKRTVSYDKSGEVAWTEWEMLIGVTRANDLIEFASALAGFFLQNKFNPAEGKYVIQKALSDPVICKAIVDKHFGAIGGGVSMEPAELIRRAESLGYRLVLSGESLGVGPIVPGVPRCPDELVMTLRRHKAKLIKHLTWLKEHP